jgi:hypothetical protein
MNRLTQATVALSISTASLLGSPATAEASGLPSDCRVATVGSAVPEATEQALVDAGFSGITTDGVVTDAGEQGNVYVAQVRMKELGVLEKAVRICGYPGEVTRKAAQLMIRPGELAAEPKGLDLASCRVSESVLVSIGDEDKVFDDEEVKLLQTALTEAGINVGRVDGVFGNRTRQGILDFQKATNLKVDCIVGNVTAGELGLLNGAVKNNANSSGDVVNVAQCSYKVITSKEAARLMGVPALSGAQLCKEIIDFQKQNNLNPDGIVGKVTAIELIVESDNPCNIYGTREDDCFVAVQQTGNLGKAYVVEGGEIIKQMSARFGNDQRVGGKKTPEGQFNVLRSKKGEHQSTECIDENGNGYVCMWNPLYFENGRKAVHGTKNPESPNGSLGCVGISIEHSAFVYKQYENGKIDKIVVLDLQRA